MKSRRRRSRGAGGVGWLSREAGGRAEKGDDGGRRRPLIGREWSRSAPAGGGLDADRPRQDRSLRRALAVVLAIIEVALLGYAVSGPWFTVGSVSVSGLHHLDEGAVVTAAGLRRPGSLLLVDGDTIRRKLARLPWVRSSSAQPVLPNRILITIEEWKPVALYQAGASGKAVYLNELGTVLADGRPDPQLVAVVGPGAPNLNPGDTPINAQLLHALVEIQASLPTIFGQSVTGFQLDCLGNLTLTTNRSVRIIFGRVLTPEEFASLKDKLSALKSIATDPAATAANVEYVNLENPLAPAVKVRGATPPPSPSPPPGTTPRPASSPTPGGIVVQPCK